MLHRLKRELRNELEYQLTKVDSETIFEDQQNAVDIIADEAVESKEVLAVLIELAGMVGHNVVQDYIESEKEAQEEIKYRNAHQPKL